MAFLRRLRRSAPGRQERPPARRRGEHQPGLIAMAPAARPSPGRYCWPPAAHASPRRNGAPGPHRAAGRLPRQRTGAAVLSPRSARQAPGAARTTAALPAALFRLCQALAVPAAIGPVLQPVPVGMARGPAAGQGGLQVAGRRRRGRSRRRVQQAGWHVGSFQGDEVAGVRHLGESGGGEQLPVGLPV